MVRVHQDSFCFLQAHISQFDILKNFRHTLVHSKGMPLGQQEDRHVEIVMATYNGVKHLQQQIDSIFNQTHTNWTLLIGDDRSTDNTPMFLAELQNKHPEKVKFLPFKTNAGIVGNFSRILEMTEADYVMFADQDDVWFPEKIEKTLHKMAELEKQYGEDVPLLVHTDMIVVDDDLKVIDKSHWHRLRFNPKHSGELNRVLVQTAAWGCTMLFNRKLVNIATPIPPEAFVHDYWLVLVAAGCGHVGYVKEPTLYYRQHSNQWLGSRAPDFAWFKNEMLNNPKFQNDEELRIMKHMLRGYMFYKRYDNFLSDEQKQMVEAFIDMKYQPLWKELYWKFKYRFYNHGFWKNLAFTIASIRMGRADPKYRQLKRD